MGELIERLMNETQRPDEEIQKDLVKLQEFLDSLEDDKFKS